MFKKDLVKLLESVEDESIIVVPSTTQFRGYNTISEDIEIVEDYDEDNKKIVIIQEKDRLL